MWLGAGVTISLSNVMKHTLKNIHISGSTAIPAPELRSTESVSELVAHHTCDPHQFGLAEFWEAERRKVEALLIEAERSAQRLLEKAKLDAASITESARQAGYESGYEEGKWQAYQEFEVQYQKYLDEFIQLMMECSQLPAKIAGHVIEPLSTAVMESLRRLLDRELHLQPAEIEEEIKSALRVVLDAGKIEIHLHPDDYRRLPEWFLDRVHQQGLQQEIIVITDETVTQGGFEIRSNVGRVDATVETKIDLLHPLFKEFIERSVLP